MERKNYLDYIRVIAIFAVVGLHVFCDRYMASVPFKSTSWFFMSGFSSLLRFADPLFLMISGAVFLDESRKLSIKKLLLHNFLRLVIVFFIWDFLYGLIVYALEFGFSFDMFKVAILNMPSFRYHLWFIPAIAGIYLLVPLLRKVCRKENREVVKYFLILGFVTICINSFARIFDENKIANYFLRIINIFNPGQFCSYVFYFVLGWYLEQFINESRYKKPLLIIGLCLVPISSGVNILFSILKNRSISLTEDLFFIVTFFMAVGVFILCKQLKFANNENKFIKSLSNCSFGIYLIHVAIIELLEKFIPEYLAFSGWGFLILLGMFIVAALGSYALTLLIKLTFRKYSRYIV